MYRPVGKSAKTVLFFILGTTLALTTGCKAFDKLFEHWHNPLADEDNQTYSVKVAQLATGQTRWQGWSAVEQTNGLLTLRHVPAIGGRTMSLELAGTDAFYINPKLKGQTLELNSKDTAVLFGGHFAGLGPQRLWNKNQQPFNPVAGPYKYFVNAEQKDRHTVRMVSQRGTWRGATIAMERSISMYKGNTHIEIQEQLTNHGPDPLDCLLWDVTRLDAIDRQRGENILRPMKIYTPVKMVDGQKKFRALKESGKLKVNKELPNDVLEIPYKGMPIKLVSDADKHWIAAVDQHTGWTYIKQFEGGETGHYIDNEGPIRVTASAYDPVRGRAVVNLELLTSFARCQPQKSIRQKAHWYATVCKGPILELTRVGAVCRKLSLKADKKYYDLAGRFGVFYRGFARLVILDRDGEPVFTGPTMPIDPREEFIVSAALPADDDADTIVLKIYDHNNEYVDNLAEVRVPRYE